MEYTIPQLEALSIALSENNDDSKDSEDEGKSFEEGCDTGVDAVNSLKQLGFI